MTNIAWIVVHLMAFCAGYQWGRAVRRDDWPYPPRTRPDATTTDDEEHGLDT